MSVEDDVGKSNLPIPFLDNCSLLSVPISILSPAAVNKSNSAIDISEFPLANYRELIGFINGIFSQNSDITKVFVDGIFIIVQSLGNEDLIKLVARLDSVSKAYNVDFVLAGNVDPAELPKEVEQYIRK